MKRTIEIDEHQQRVLMAALRFWQWYQWECREPSVDDFDRKALELARENGNGDRLLRMRSTQMDRLYRKIRGRKRSRIYQSDSH